jgi:hypothetical protein
MAACSSEYVLDQLMGTVEKHTEASIVINFSTRVSVILLDSLQNMEILDSM